MERARRGDLDAYGELVRQHEQLACRVAYGIAGDDAEDAVQEALVKAHAALGRFRTGAPFRPWLMRIVVNEARNRRRSAGRRGQLALRLSTTMSHEDERTPEDATIAESGRARLLEAVRRLTDRDREVVVCRYFAEMSEAEMADALGCRPGTVKSRLSRALERLAHELREEVPS